jgi:EmrB/QacA subfamily drug resistance transporter
MITVMVIIHMASTITLLQGDRRRWAALAVVCLAQLMVVLDATIVTVALPAIQSDLHMPQAHLTWVVNAYLIAFGGLLLFAGRLGDLVGRRRVFLAGVIGFTAASALCAVAATSGMLIGARVLQGVGAAVCSSVVLAIVATEFRDPAERAKAMSVYMLVSLSGGSLGLLLGGALVEALDWHWIFAVNVPVGIVALAAGRALVARDEGIGLREGIDWLGSLLVTGAVMLLAYAIVTAADHGWGSARTLGLGAIVAALFAAFLAVEARSAHPIMPLRILRLRSLIDSSIVRGMVYAGIYSMFFFGALVLQRIMGFSALETGAAFLPMTSMVAVSSLLITPRLLARIGPKLTLVPGLTFTFAGLAVLTQVGAGDSYASGPLIAFVLFGLGGGLTFVPLLTIAMSEVPPADAGLASGIVNVSMQVSAAIGLAAMGTIATSRTSGLEAAGRGEAASLLGGYHLVFEVGALLIAGALVLALALLRSPRREEPVTAEAVDAALAA